MAAIKIRVRDREFTGALPALDLREDLVFSYGAKWKANRHGLPVQRVCAAMLGLCIPEVMFGLQTTANPRDDLFSYGAEVYNGLRDKGWTAADILKAGNDLAQVLIAETFPREEEVKAAGKSEGGAGPSDEKPSA